MSQGIKGGEALFKLSYGLFVLIAKDGEKDNGCIINTVQQATSKPEQIAVTLNKENFTHDMIKKTGIFNVSILTEEANFFLFQRFGFQSGRNVEKFSEEEKKQRSQNGLVYLKEVANACLSGKVWESFDCGTHTIFLAKLTEAFVLSDAPSVTYQYYFERIKPKPALGGKTTKGYICIVCGYVYEGEELPADFICPVCKHGAEDFEKLE